MRLTMKPGVDFACTAVLPQSCASVWMASATAGSVASPDTTSTSRISGTGLKKCMPTTRPGSLRPRAMAVIDSDEVLDASTQVSATSASRSRNRPCLTARFSTMASITSAESASSPSDAAGRTRPRADATSSGVSLPLSASLASVAISCSMAAAAAPSRVSYSRTGWPASSATCTMPTPITPAPITATGRPWKRFVFMTPFCLQPHEGGAPDNGWRRGTCRDTCRPRGRVSRGVGSHRAFKPPCATQRRSGGRSFSAGTLSRPRTSAAPTDCRPPMPRPAPPPPVEDDGPTAAEAASHARDLRGAARLATEATTGLTDLVEAVHARIASVPGLPGPADGRTGGITGLVYKTIRGVTKVVGGSVDTLLGALAPALALRADAAAGLPSPEREAIVAALNGVLGDHLARTANPLAIRMALRSQGRALPLQRQALAAALPDAGGAPLVLIHGLCMNDLQWRRSTGTREQPASHDHGAALAAALGFTPVYLHYDSGLHVSTNGRALANLLEKLLEAWPRPIARFAIVAHGMGGLLARSALHYARAAGHHWPDRLHDPPFLRTPHHGASMERAGQGLDMLLGDTPLASPLARLATLHSAGITDLRHGNLVDE